jgi:uncharacterized repeat protein (TIGR03803 family)
VFALTQNGALKTVYSFCKQSACTDGANPYGGLVEGSNGILYGTTAAGGEYGISSGGYGTVFQITTTGFLTRLYSFCAEVGCTDGGTPMAGLAQDTDGIFYGTTAGFGGDGDGTVFSLSVGLGPFLQPQTASGRIGSTVKILGTNLTGATSVTFNGAEAEFTINGSGSAITATVPANATTGLIQVVTPAGTLSSSVHFSVKPN